MKKKWGSHFIELIIVIAGVSIAFWLNQIAENNSQDKIRVTYLQDLQEDLKNDKRRLEYSAEFNRRKMEGTSEVAALFVAPDDNKQEIIEQALRIGNFGFFVPDDFTYQSMIASGDFKLLGNADIKRSLIALYADYQNIDELQRNYVQALDDNFFPYVMDNFDYLTNSPTSADFHKSQVVRNFFAFTINELTLHVRSYENASESVQKLDSLINLQLQ